MLKVIAAGILAFRANERVHYAHIAYRDVHHIHLLHNYKPWVKVIGTGQYHVFLQTLHTACIDKGDRILEVLMARYRYAGYLAFFQRLAIQGGNNAHLVFMYLRYRHSYNIEQKGVDTIATRRKEGSLRAFLAAVVKESGSI